MPIKSDSQYCSKCHHKYPSYSVRECPHPVVQARIGKIMCIACCGKCKHAVRFIHHGGISCCYGKDEPNEQIRNGLLSTAKCPDRNCTGLMVAHTNADKYSDFKCNVCGKQFETR